MFHFKHFSVDDNNCGMKIGVDGVLLGAWVKQNNVKRILDVGTGSGLIALMMAQKFPKAEINAIEIESSAAIQCADNINNSPFSNDFKIFEGNYLNQEECKLEGNFDIIVSNLPYFNNGPEIRDVKRDLARSARHLPVLEFLSESKRLLADAGAIYFIYPEEILISLKDTIANLGLKICTIAIIKGTAQSKAKRCLFKVRHGSCQQEDNSQYEIIIIEETRGVYTEMYKNLCRDFYLKF